MPPPCGIAGIAGFGSGFSATIASVVTSKPAIDAASCIACRTRIRPALMQQLKRGELVFCEGCHRILHLEKPAS